MSLVSEHGEEPPRQRLALTPEALVELLEASGWPCERLTSDTVRTHIQGAARVFPLLARLEPGGYLVFAVVPYLKSPQERARAAALYRRLLELNRSLWLAKFSIDDDLDVVLSAEYPLAELDRSEFEDALDVISYYADRYYAELSGLARE